MKHKSRVYDFIGSQYTCKSRVEVTWWTRVCVWTSNSDEGRINRRQEIY